MRAFTIFFEVPSQNVCERRHWSARRREQQGLLLLIRAALGEKRSDVETQQRVSITAYRKRLIRDQANLVGGCKGLVDALTTSGLLVDDSTKWARFTYDQQLAGKDRPKTVIEINEGKW